MNLKNNALFWIYASIFIISLSLGAYNPLIPLYAQQLGATYFDLGIIGAAWALPYLLLPISIGVLSEKINRRWIFLAGIASSAANAALFLFAHNVSHMIAIRVFGGIAYAMMWPTVEAIISDITSVESRTKAMGRYSFSYGMGFLIGPALGGLLLERTGFTALFIVSLLIGAIATVIALFGLKVHYEPRTQKIDRNAGIEFDFLKKELAPIYLAIVAYSFALGTVFSLFPAYASDKGFGSIEIGILFAVLGLVRVMVSLQSESISRIGETRAIFIALFIQAITLPVLPYLDGFFTLLFGMALFGFILGILSPLTLSVVSKIAPREKIGIAIGAVEASFGFGMTAGPFVGGIAAQSVGAESPYVITGLISFIVSIPVILSASAKELAYQRNPKT